MKMHSDFILFVSKQDIDSEIKKKHRIRFHKQWVNFYAIIHIWKTEIDNWNILIMNVRLGTITVKIRENV